MQKDMHYHGTYAMARAAGIKPDTAHVIATAAQYVDDNTAEEAVDFKDGARLRLQPTAYSMLAGGNLDRDKQRHVWLPFHFLPGGEGESYVDRLVCRRDSHIAREMVEHHLGLSTRRFAPSLMGLTAHVYADTFSHYGFAGISCPHNEVVQDGIRLLAGDAIKGYITEKAGVFWDKYKATLTASFAEGVSGALGHGSVATYPDRPYLEWEFPYEKINLYSYRKNQVTFLDACRALHGMFSRFVADRPDLDSDDARPFDAIEETVTDILKLEGSEEERSKAWEEAARQGTLFGSGGEDVPAYMGEAWQASLDDIREQDSRDAAKDPVFHFYQAAALHRSYVLRMLLPKYGIVVS